MKVGIVGLKISALSGNPLETLLGNSVRSWALFTLLEKYGHETFIYVETEAEIDPKIKSKYQRRFVKSRAEFISLSENFFDITIICSTKINHIIREKPWLNGICGNIHLALCYHNEPFIMPKDLGKAIRSVSFVNPKFIEAWQLDQRTCLPSFVMSTGQVIEKIQYLPDNRHMIYMGWIHSREGLLKLLKIAELLPDFPLVISTNGMRLEKQYFSFKGDPQEPEIFECEMKKTIGRLVKNVSFEFIPNGLEKNWLQKSFVGLDVCWNKNWILDNSKVCNYLSKGLFVATEGPSESGRFVERCDAGIFFPFGQREEYWAQAIRTIYDRKSPAKHMDIAKKAEALFSWENIAFETHKFTEKLWY
jgi:glycosyltransferase involved in cell wall biosynthesis